MSISNRSSLRLRITLLTGALATLLCIVTGALVVLDVRHREEDERREQLTESIYRAQNHIKARAFPSALAPDGDEATQVLDPYGQVITSTPQLIGRPRMATFQPAPDRRRAERTLCPPAHLKGCMTVVAVKDEQPNGTWTIYVAVPVVPWYADSTLAIFLVTVALLIIALVTMGVCRAVGRTLEPVHAIRTEMEEITATDIHRRVPVPKTQDEIGTLATSVNTMLERLDAAYEELRRFTADASHEVRSPLTAIRAQVEEALMYPDDTDWPQTGRAVLSAAERLQELVTDLLILARLDAGVAPPRDPVDVAQLTQAELDRRAPAVEVFRDLQRGVLARCDQARVTRLLANLMDNAERHTRSRITVTVRGDERWAVLTVADDGAGIPAEAREMVFRRFARLDTARNREAGGSGLGLAIARQVAEMHGGTLTVEDSERGACFLLRLPRYRPPPRSATAPRDRFPDPD